MPIFKASNNLLDVYNGGIGVEVLTEVSPSFSFFCPQDAPRDSFLPFKGEKIRI